MAGRVRIRMTVTIPKEILSFNVVRAAIEDKMRSKTAPDLTRMFKGTVEGWDNKPEWGERHANSPDRVSTSIYARGRNVAQYRLVNNGASAHTIVPRKQNGFLTFQRGYRAATRPYSLISRPKLRWGSKVRAWGVYHPGFEAREFDATIADEYYDTFAEDMQSAIHFAVQKV